MNKLTELEKSTATLAWSEAKKNFNTVKNLIDYNTVFTFSKEVCAMVDNKKKYVQIHVGINENEEVLFIIPIKEELIEANERYISVTAKALDSHLVFEEEKKMITTRTITLAHTLEVISNIEKRDLPFENVPTIGSAQAILEIQSWRNKYLDWLFIHSKNNSVFNSFFTPTKDLELPNPEHLEIKCLFAMRESALENNIVPTLIFVTVINSPIDQGSSVPVINVVINNTENFASPCPPFCRLDPIHELVNASME
jgi:hypothetical protein